MGCISDPLSLRLSLSTPNIWHFSFRKLQNEYLNWPFTFPCMQRRNTGLNRGKNHWPGPSWPQREVIMSSINTGSDARSHPLDPSTVRTLQEFILNLNWAKLKHAPCCACERCSQDPWWSDRSDWNSFALFKHGQSSTQLVIASGFLLCVQTAVHIALNVISSAQNVTRNQTNQRQCNRSLVQPPITIHPIVENSPRSYWKIKSTWGEANSKPQTHLSVKLTTILTAGGKDLYPQGIFWVFSDQAWVASAVLLY